MYVYPINHILPIGSVLLYILAVYLIPKILSGPVKVAEKIMIPWNFLLWIGSVFMFLGGTYGLYEHYARLGHSFYNLICDVT